MIYITKQKYQIFRVEAWETNMSYNTTGES